MERDKQLALFTKPIPSLYRHYLLPTLLAMASNSLYCLADVFFVAKGAGSSGLAAMNIAMPLFTIYSAVGLTLGVGCATVMSIAEGKGSLHIRDKAFTACLAGLGVIGLLFSIVGSIFIEPFALLLGSSRELLEQVIAYMLPVNTAAVFFIFNYAGSVLLRNDHAPKLAMAATMSGNIANIVLDYVFVIVMKQGIFGAAVATALGPLLSLGIMSWHFLRRRNTVHLHGSFMEMSLWRRILVNGSGSGILELSAGVIILVFNYVILQEADAQFLAAYAIVTNIAFVSKGLLNGFAQAAQPMLSANHGAKRGDRVKQSFLISIRYGLYFSQIVYALLLLFPYQVAEVFAQDSTEVVRIGADGLRLYFTSLPLSALITMLLYYFQSIEEGQGRHAAGVLEGRRLCADLPVLACFAVWDRRGMVHRDHGGGAGGIERPAVFEEEAVIWIEEHCFWSMQRHMISQRKK